MYIGRLSHSKKGVGSIIGAVFLILILMSGYAFYTLNFNVTKNYTKTIQDMQQLDLERSRQKIEFISVSFNQNGLNIGNVKNCTTDLEVQWTSVNYNKENEWMPIYCNKMGNETLFVYVWNGTEWINIISHLLSGWNSVSVSSYLTLSTFTIRFKGEIETSDTSLDSWEIDTAFLYV